MEYGAAGWPHAELNQLLFADREWSVYFLKKWTFIFLHAFALNDEN